MVVIKTRQSIANAPPSVGAVTLDPRAKSVVQSLKASSIQYLAGLAAKQNSGPVIARAVLSGEAQCLRVFLAQAKGVNCLNARRRETEFYFHLVNGAASAARPFWLIFDQVAIGVRVCIAVAVNNRWRVPLPHQFLYRTQRAAECIVASWRGVKEGWQNNNILSAFLQQYDPVVLVARQVVGAASVAHFACDDELIILDVLHFDLLHQALRCASGSR